MKDFFSSLHEIKKKIDSFDRCALLLDFDGTLSKIAKTPNKAFLENKTKKLLEELSKTFTVAIISGRDISDLKSRINLPGITYAGNHGFEWQLEGGKYNKVKISPTIRKKLSLVKKGLKSLESKYNNLRLQEKKFSLSLHYRNLSEKDLKSFLKESKSLVSSFKQEKEIEIFWGKKLIEVRPKIKWNKGHFAIFFIKYFEEKFRQPILPFYIGDDTTDEDAFRVVRNGVAIRIGKKKSSSAKYYILQSEINRLLTHLISSKNFDSILLK